MEDHSFCNMTEQEFDRLIAAFGLFDDEDDDDLFDGDDVTDCGWLFDDEDEV